MTDPWRWACVWQKNIYWLITNAGDWVSLAQFIFGTRFLLYRNGWDFQGRSLVRVCVHKCLNWSTFGDGSCWSTFGDGSCPDHPSDTTGSHIHTSTREDSHFNIKQQFFCLGKIPTWYQLIPCICFSPHQMLSMAVGHWRENLDILTF